LEKSKKNSYHCREFVQCQAPQGVWNFNLKPVYVVSILDFKIFEAKEDAEHVIAKHEAIYTNLLHLSIYIVLRDTRLLHTMAAIVIGRDSGEPCKISTSANSMKPAIQK
jgi:hypothetical protein